jgi:DNA ligase (NAD+)
MKNETKIAKLEKQIIKARNDYYNETPTVSDDVFDAWVDELAGLKENSVAITAVGAPVPVSEWKKVAHEIPMGSLDKVNAYEELVDWANKQNGHGYMLLISEKLDGISIRLRYENGVFIQAASRGNAIEGEDITTNVAKMKGVPAKLTESFTGNVRGEIVLTHTDHKLHFPTYSNPRNAASGIAKRYDGEGSEYLTIMTYKIIDGADQLKTEEEQFEYLKKLGFNTPNYYPAAFTLSGNKMITPDELWNNYQKSIRDSLDYDIDGLVITFDNIDFQTSLGEKDNRPKGSVAFKFRNVSKKSVLRGIEWQVGSSGRITPVGNFDEVEIVGAKITNASLYNWKYIQDMKLDIGAKIVVIRANDVIPKIISAFDLTGTIAQAPKKCPVCGTNTEMDGEYVICPNTIECPAQLVGRIQSYVDKLDIKEWGDKLIQNLVESGLVEDVAGLYTLTKEELANLDRMGEKSAENVLKTLWDKNPITLDNLVGSLSIPLCGRTMLRLVVDAGFDTWDKMVNAKQSEFENIVGFGQARAEALYNWIHSIGEILVPKLLNAGVELKGKIMGNLTGKSFCFTGKMNNKRDVLEAMAVAAGGTTKGSVGKGLTYLVLADPNSTSGKALAARKNNTTCISEEEFLEMVA